MRAMLYAMLLCAGLTACDRTNTAILKRHPTGVGGDVAFDDPSAGQTATRLLQISSSIASTSPDGSEADLLLTYTLDPIIRTALKPSSFVIFEYVVPNRPRLLVARASIDDELGGVAEVTVPTSDVNAKLVATIGGLQAGEFDDEEVLVAQIPAVLTRETSDLTRVQDVSAELIEGSYESMLVDGRRVHKFAVKVIDPTAGPIDDLLTEDDDPALLEYSISGLEKNASAHFVALENDSVDGESPVTAVFDEHPLAVYLVIDASSSIVDSRQAHHLSHAVSNTVIALAKNAQIDYRSFNGAVKRISGLRELDFDTNDASASAVYYALDTALTDIENFGSIQQDKVVLVFTDGKDLASRNHYNDSFIDNEQVHEYIVQRVQQVRSYQENVFGRQLDVYTIGFYVEGDDVNVSEEIRKLDRISEAGGTIESYNNLTISHIDNAFAAVVQNIRGVYYLQYSSQQTADNNKLELLVKVNGHQTRLQLPTDFKTSMAPGLRQ